MKPFLRIFTVAALLVFTAALAHAGGAIDADTLAKKGELPDRILGSLSSPIKVDEYVSLTCPHCAEFYNTTMPEIEKDYIDTGKVRFVLHTIVMDRVGMKATILARCMPEDEFFPFIKVLYANQKTWAYNPNPEAVLLSYAKLGGLSDDKAKACLADTKLQDAIIAEQTAVSSRVTATPTFIINDSSQTINGALPFTEFAKVFDNLLASKK